MAFGNSPLKGIIPKIMTSLYQKQKQNKIKLNLRIANRIILILIIIQGVFYMTGVNDLIVKGFKLQELKSNSGSLNDENRSLSIKTTSLKSYSNLASRVEDLRMVATGDIEYIKLNKGEVAIK